MSEAEEIQEERDRQREWSAHQSNWQQAAQDLEREKERWLDKLMRTDMSDAGIQLLDNMVDRAFILGNITDAEYFDKKWWLEVVYIQIRSNFPREESMVTGEIRQFIKDDRDENLTPLTGQQRLIIKQMLEGVAMLISRSKGGFQQEMNVKSITVSEVLNPDEENEEGLWGGLMS